MKTQNTPDNKAKFYGLYFGQEVERFKGGNDTYSVNGKSFRGHQLAPLPGSYLSLKPLSQITDEDAKSVIDIFMRGWKYKVKGIVRIFVSKKVVQIIVGDDGTNVLFWLKNRLQIWAEDNSGETITTNYLEIYDFLRSKGYLLPWLDLSVEEILKYGWAKYNEQ